MKEIEKNTLSNIKITRDFSFYEDKKKTNDKSVRYSADTNFGKMNKKSTTSFDMFGNIVRPIIINNKYYIRHDRLTDRSSIYGIF
jgi:hypothetical protein